MRARCFFGQVFSCAKSLFLFSPFHSHPSSPLSSFLPTLFHTMFAPRIAAPLRNVGRVQGNVPLPTRPSATTATTKRLFPSSSIDTLSLASGISLSLGENRLAFLTYVTILTDTHNHLGLFTPHHFQMRLPSSKYNHIGTHSSHTTTSSHKLFIPPPFLSSQPARLTFILNALHP